MTSPGGASVAEVSTWRWRHDHVVCELTAERSKCCESEAEHRTRWLVCRSAKRRLRRAICDGTRCSSLQQSHVSQSINQSVSKMSRNEAGQILTNSRNLLTIVNRMKLQRDLTFSPHLISIPFENETSQIYLSSFLATWCSILWPRLAWHNLLS